MSKRTLIAGFFVLLFLAHQDFWWRSDPRLVLGFLPISLAYHVGWTLFVALGWYLVGKYCWPHALDAEPPPRSGSGSPEPGTPPRSR
jgi:hypothetical protein